MAEEARLESVYTPKGYPEFESRSLRPKLLEFQLQNADRHDVTKHRLSAFFLLNCSAISKKKSSEYDLCRLNDDQFRLITTEDVKIT